MNAPLDDTIGMKHGAGGRAMRALIEQVFAPGLPPMKVEGVGLSAMDDGAALRIGDRYLVVTTDSHVIQPVFFPGGDIGRLAVAGTVNDLAMMGATDALALTFSVIVEEGFPRRDLERIHETVGEVEPDRVGLGIDPAPLRLVDYAADLAQAPAQLAARIVGHVPQQLAELAARHRAGSQRQIGEQRAHLARGRQRGGRARAHDGEGSEQPHPQPRIAAGPIALLRIHGHFHASSHATLHHGPIGLKSRSRWPCGARPRCRPRTSSATA